MIPIAYGPWRHGESNDAECETCEWEATTGDDRKVAAQMRKHIRYNPAHTIVHWRTFNRVVFKP